MEMCVPCPTPLRKLSYRLQATILLLATVRGSVGFEWKSSPATAPIVNAHANDHAMMRTEVLTTTQMMTATSAQNLPTKGNGHVHAQMLHSGAMHIIHDKQAVQHPQNQTQSVQSHKKVLAEQSKVTTSKTKLASSNKLGNSNAHKAKEGTRVREHSGSKLSKGATPRPELLSSKKPNEHVKRKVAKQLAKASSTTPRPDLPSASKNTKLGTRRSNNINDRLRAREKSAPKLSKSTTPRSEPLYSKQAEKMKDGGLDKHGDGMRTHEQMAAKNNSIAPRPELTSSKPEKSLKDNRLHETHNDSMPVHDQSAPTWNMGATSKPQFASSNQAIIGKENSSEKQGNNKELRDGFQERFDDDWSEQQRGYTWKQEHDSRDEENDDDWDDERQHKDVTVGDGDGVADPDSSDGDGDGDDGDSYNNLQPEVDVTGEKDVTIAPDTGPLKAVTPHQPKPQVPENDVERLGEGIGAMAYERSPTGSRSINHEIRERLEFQDCAAFAILLSVFVLTVLLSCFSVYQVAEDPSPVAYYSEPKNYRQQRVMCETADADSFLAAFNTQPEDVRIRIIGKNPEPGGFRRFLRTLHPHTMRPRGLSALLPVRQRRLLPVLFDVSLDLTPFITGNGRVSDDNMEILQTYLNSKNRLETLLLQKRVDWAHFKDVATNVRQQLRSLGFPGEVDVRFEAYDEVLVYQNHKWTNFVRNRVTQALVVISVVGSFFWLPYVWTRTKKTKIESRFQVNVDPGRFWQLVSEGLSAAEGFQAT